MAMLTPSQETRDRDLVAPDHPIYRFSVAQYHAMIDAQVLTENDSVELLEGWLFAKMPKNPAHIFSTQVLNDLLRSILPDGWFVNVQDPITTRDSEPEPDIVVIRGERRDYLEQKPGPSAVGLIVEVADATLHQDETLKKRVYATAVIPVYWIVDLQNGRILVHTEPAAGDYEQRRLYLPGEEIPVVLDGDVVGHLKVADILP